MQMHRLFVYGTLKRGFYNYHILLDRANGCSTFIGNGIPCLLPSLPSQSSADKTKHTYVRGELFEIDESMLARLDILEECPTWYTRTQTTCTLVSSSLDKYQKGSHVSCEIYFKTNPDPEYYTLPSISSFVQDDSFIPKTQW